MKSIKLSIVTPEKKFFEGEVKKIITENINGSLGILPEHIPMVTLLEPTITTFFTSEGEEKRAFTSTGVLKVSKDRVDMLCEACEWPEDIDMKRAEESHKRAKMRLSSNDEGVDVKRAEMSLKKALLRKKINE